MSKKHPYGRRKWWRERLPWFLIDLGIAKKGIDCHKVNAEHNWYNKNNVSSACYYCKVIEQGQKWKNQSNETIKI